MAVLDLRTVHICANLSNAVLLTLAFQTVLVAEGCTNL